MPAKKEVTLRYPEEFVKNALNHFSTNLHTELSSRGFLARKLIWPLIIIILTFPGLVTRKSIPYLIVVQSKANLIF